MKIQVGELIEKAVVNRCGDRDYPVLSMTMHEGLMFQNDRFKKQIASKDQSNYQVVKRHQLVESFPIDEGVLAVQELTDEGIVSPAYKIWDVNAEKVIPLYLEFALRAPRSIEYYKSKLRGTTARRRSITDAEFCAMRINCPDLKEQERVIGLVKKTKSIIAKRQQELICLDQLIKARFVELFGSIHDSRFEEKTLPEIVIDDKNAIKRGPFGGALKKEDFVDSGYLVYEQRHAIHEDFEYAKYYVTKEKYENMIGFKVVPRDLIISCSGVTLGRIAEIPRNAKEGIINQALLKLSLNQEIMMNPFFIQQFRSEEIQDVLFGFSRGSGIPNMPSMSEIKAVKFICPPIELQKEYCDFLNQVDKSKVAVQKALNEAQLLFDSLMQKYFG